MKTATTISLLNHKGGVGKTTSTVNLAAEFSRRGLRVLCVDCDPLASLSKAAGQRTRMLAPEHTALAALLPEIVDVDLDELAVPAPWGGDLWPASKNLVLVERKLRVAKLPRPHQRLRSALAHHAGGYDLVLVDTPPSLGKLVLNAIGAADFVLVPVMWDMLSLDGLEELLDTLELFRDYERVDPEVLGVFGTQLRQTRSAAAGRALRSGDADGLQMETSIPHSVVVQEAQSRHQAVCEYEPDHKVAQAYAALADEVAARLAARRIELRPTVAA